MRSPGCSGSTRSFELLPASITLRVWSSRKSGSSSPCSGVMLGCRGDSAGSSVAGRRWFLLDPRMQGTSIPPVHLTVFAGISQVDSAACPRADLRPEPRGRVPQPGRRTQGCVGSAPTQRRKGARSTLSPVVVSYDRKTTTRYHHLRGQEHRPTGLRTRRHRPRQCFLEECRRLPQLAGCVCAECSCSDKGEGVVDEEGGGIGVDSRNI